MSYRNKRTAPSKKRPLLHRFIGTMLKSRAGANNDGKADMSDSNDQTSVPSGKKLHPINSNPIGPAWVKVTPMEMLKSRADANNDGKVTREEMQEYFSNADLNSALVSQLKKMVAMQGIAAAVIIVVLAIVTGFAIQLAKESHVTDSVFVDKSGNAVQCASKEMQVSDNGVLTNKANQAAIRTLKAPAVSHPLNSKVPDK